MAGETEKPTRASRLPWWTWILPLPIYALASLASSRFGTMSGFALLYLEVPLAMALCYWWGPRTLLAFFLNAVLCSGLLGLSRWNLYPLYAIPETLEIFLSWLLFKKMARGDARLPDLKNAFLFLLLGVLIPTLSARSLGSSLLVLTGDLDPSLFMKAFAPAWLYDLFGVSSIGVILLAYLSPAISKAGLAHGSPEPLEYPFSGQRSLRTAETIIYSALALAAAFIFRDKEHWWLIGIILMIGAARTGMRGAVWANLAAYGGSQLMPLLIYGPRDPMFGYSIIENNGRFGLAVFSVTALVVGKAVGDLASENRIRRGAELAARESEARNRILIEVSLAADRKEACWRLLKGAMAASGADSGGVYVMDHSAGVLRLESHAGLSADFIAVSREYGPDTPNVTVIRAGRAVYSSMGSLRKLPQDDIRLKEGLRAIALVPLLHSGRVMGCLNLASKAFETFKDEPKALIEALGGMAGSILARLESEDEAKRSHAELKTLFESIEDFVIVSDAEGLILDANPYTLSRLGYGSDELRSMRIPELHPAERAEEARAAFEAILAGKADRCELPIVAKDGTLIPVETKAVWGAWNGKPAVYGFSRDETEKRRADQALLTAQKLESIGILAGGIAHDFGNLLGAMLGYVEMGRDAATAGQTAKAAEFLDKALGASVRARSLTQQLLTFAKGGTPARRPEDIVRIVERAARFAVSGSNVRIAFSAEPAVIVCDADAGQIERVVDNLVINARQAMPDGGEAAVRVSIPPRPPAGLAPGAYARIEVRDAGSGMSREELGKVFDPFYTTKSKGSGLGLTVCYSIVKKHGGTIEAESEPGKGSSFAVYLPISASESAAAADDPGAARKFAGRVLVMDDEEMNRDLLSAMLQKLGLSAQAYPEGAQAVEAFRSAAAEGQPFSLAILDLTIPGGMGGKDTLAALTELAPGLKAIAVSGYSDDPVIAEPHSYGFSASMKKPFLQRDLNAALRDALAS